jgi:hypothetical protein
MDFLNIDYPSPDDFDIAADSEDILLFPPNSPSKPSKEEGVVAVDPLQSEKLSNSLNDNLWNLK